jgi:hypothetical protein
VDHNGTNGAAWRIFLVLVDVSLFSAALTGFRLMVRSKCPKEQLDCNRISIAYKRSVTTEADCAKLPNIAVLAITERKDSLSIYLAFLHSFHL